MISGNYTTVPISSITINRESRQRVTLPDLTALADSIRRIGLVHAPVITTEGVLVSGECRLTACRDILGWTDIPVQLTSDLDESTAHLIELEENVRRTDLTWQDQCLAIAAYHDLSAQDDSGWTAAKTATALSISESEVSQRRMVAVELITENEMITNADKYSVAIGIVKRKADRVMDSANEALGGMLDSLLPVMDTSDLTEVESAEPGMPSQIPLARELPIASNAPIFRADFTEWQPKFLGQKFNLIHCDFPYGIDHDTHAQSSMSAHGSYSDTAEVYWTLLDTLEAAMENVIAKSAHMIFWFSMTHYTTTLTRLRAMGWACDGFPLVWDKLNQGTLPDPSRGPRRGYEVAFFCSRGDRKIVRAKNNITCGPPDKRYHTSAKPTSILQHFFLMLVDETTKLLDPTCGSGNALVVLKQRFPAARGLGLEIDSEFHARACENWDSAVSLFD